MSVFCKFNQFCELFQIVIDFANVMGDSYRNLPHSY